MQQVQEIFLSSYISKVVEEGASICLALARGEMELSTLDVSLAGADSPGYQLREAVINSMAVFYAIKLGLPYEQHTIDRLLAPLFQVKPLKNYIAILKLSRGE